jgi:23S rRNA pseudouridine1911/1915/1917 synthase
MSEKHIVPKNSQPQFLNSYAPKIFPLVASKAKAKKAIVNGEITVNGKTVNYDAKVYPGDQIILGERKVRNDKKPLKKVLELKIDVVYEDEHLGILNKPGGIPVNGNTFKTLENTLPFNLKFSVEKDALHIMRPLHRLDGPTSGLVLVAKTERAQVIMGQQFENKTIRKRYKAVVVGKLEHKKGKISSPVDHKKSLTEYEVIEEFKSQKYGDLTLVDLFPITGRTHQLRIHMSSLGHPIVGDKFYSNNTEVLNGKGLFLCSDKVWFNHPITNNKLEISTEIPNKFNAFTKREQERFLRMNE